MRTIAFALTVCFTVALARADPPRPDPAPLPTGKWSVEFTNGVVEKVEIKKDGTASVTEPARASDGKVTAVLGTFLFVRAERIG